VHSIRKGIEIGWVRKEKEGPSERGGKRGRGREEVEVEVE